MNMTAMTVGALALFASSGEEPHTIYSVGAVTAQSISESFCTAPGPVRGELFACLALVSVRGISQVAELAQSYCLDEPGEAEDEAYGLGFQAENGLVPVRLKTCVVPRGVPPA